MILRLGFIATFLDLKDLFKLSLELYISLGLYPLPNRLEYRMPLGTFKNFPFQYKIIEDSFTKLQLFIVLVAT